MSTVPIQLAHLQLSTLAFNRSPYLNLGTAATLQQGYQQALTTQQANAPLLTAAVNGPGVYAGSDGHKYFVPAAQLAFRANLPRTPDITFTSDGKTWKILLIIHLLRPSGSDTTAIALLMNSYRVDIASGDQTPGFTFPTVTPFSPPDGSTGIVGLLKAEGVIDETLALTLLRDKPNAHLEVIGNLSYRYTFTRRIDPPPAPAPAPTPVPHPIGPPRPMMPLQRTAVPLNQRMIHPAGFAFHPTPQPQPTFQTVTQGVTADQTLAGAISAHFDPGLMDFKPIYTVLMGTGSDGTVWSEQTGQGYSRPASGSDAYYVLPDCFRMALDANSGLPSMSLLLVETPPATPEGSTTFTLRVRLAVAPLLDGGRLERMRESLRTSQNILYAQLAIGGYSSATFLASALFAELPGFQSAVLDADKSSNIDAASGFELVLDCSLEFYALLTKLLCSADGLQGSVQFQIVTSHVDATPPVETSLLVSVPVVLSFIGPCPIKLLPQVSSAKPDDKNAASIAVSVTNPLQVPLSVSGIYPTLMKTDPDLGVTTGASLLTASLDTLAFAAAEQKIVTVGTAAGGPLPSYTALAVDFGSVTPTFDPAAVLNHYQDLVATSGVNATAHFNCYLLKHTGEIPPSLANLLGMQIEVQHGAGAVVNVPLTRDTPSMDVAIPYTVAELLAGASLSQPTFQYRAKSIFPDHAGPFSDWIAYTGDHVEITPV
jgi:hypothetical protein